MIDDHIYVNNHKIDKKRHDQSYTCGFVLTCMQTEEFEMHASTKIIVVTGFTTELHAGQQRVHFSILQPFL